MTEMSLWAAALLGVIQGVTEFLPVSSSGHLVIAQHMMGMSEGVLVFDAVIHGGSLLAILWVFRADLALIWRSLRPSRRGGGAAAAPGGEAAEGAAAALAAAPAEVDATPAATPAEVDALSGGGRRLLTAIVVATLPLAAVGLLARPLVEQAFNSLYVTPILLYVTGVLLLLGERMKTDVPRPLTHGRALNVGLFQVLAVLPGLSRSGVTIAAGMMMGLSREQATRFAFLLAIPALAGATILELRSAMQADVANIAGPGALLVGTVASGLATWWAVVLFLRFVRQRNLLPFVLWCWLVATAFLVVVTLA